MFKINIFISCSSKDSDFCQKLKDGLKSFSSASKNLEWNIWSDVDLKVGEDYERRIIKNIDNSSAAILFISQNFFNSDFIKNTEFPKILEKARNENYTIFPILIKKCDYTQWDEIEKLHFFKPLGQDYNVPMFRDKIVPYYSIKEEDLLDDYYMKCVAAFEEAVLEGKNQPTNPPRKNAPNQTTSDNALVNDDPNILFSFAWNFENGLGVEKDFNRAFYWYKLAAEKGHVAAMNNLGACYSEGIGVKKDRSQAFYWFKKSAENGSHVAMDNLAWRYQFGVGTKKDDMLAFHWYKKSAELGNNRAMYELGMCYTLGKGCGIDNNQAIFWHEKAADSGNAAAMNSIGNLHYHRNDLSSAFLWYQKGAVNNDPNAMYNLSACYYYGNGTEKDSTKAAYWYEKAKINGCKTLSIRFDIHPNKQNNYKWAFEACRYLLFTILLVILYSVFDNFQSLSKYLMYLCLIFFVDNFIIGILRNKLIRKNYFRHYPFLPWWAVAIIAPIVISFILTGIF